VKEFLVAVAVGAMMVCAGAVLAAPAAPPAGLPAGLTREVVCVTDTVSAGVPVALKITWKNTTGQPISFPTEDLRTVTVEKVGGAARPFSVKTTALMTRGTSTTLDAGKTLTRMALLVVGRDPAKAAMAPLEWLFPEAGQYRVTLEGLPTAGPIVVTVQDPAPADAEARKLWTPEMAGCLTGDAANAKPMLPQLEQIYQQSPMSGYGAYALWVKARYASQNAAADRRELDRASDACLAILERHPEVAVQDEVAELYIEMCRASFRGARGRELAMELAQKSPDSEAVARLRRSYGPAFNGLLIGAPGTDESPTVAKATLTMTGLDKVPEGPRAAFKTFWDAAAAGDFKPAEALLAGDFMGDWGSRSSATRNLWRQRQGAPCTQIRITVTTASLAKTYTRPATLPYGLERTWYGPLCIIEANLSGTGGPAVKGEPAGVELPRAVWVFCEYPVGTWKLVSEICTTQHLAAASGGEQLARDLPKTIITWHVSDGVKDRFPYEEIRKQAGVTGRVIDDQTKWITHTVVMMGEKKDQVLLTGQIHLVTPSSPGVPERVVDRRVRIVLALDAKGVMTLKDLKVTDEPPVPEAGPPTRAPAN
jgi:hypothetical protein